MKTLLIAGTALALVAGINFAPGMLQSAAAAPQPVTANTPHYEWQYHYGGSPRHPRWEAGWVLVK
jgi:hypothetical protein